MAKIIIIGAGAAGLFCAGAAAQNGHDVTVLEHKEKPGRKLLITGKGRCNVTNECDVDEFLKNIRRNPRFLYSALHACPPQKIMQRFEELGVPLKTERGRRVFPCSDRAQDILDALLRWAADAQIRYTGVQKLLMKDGVAQGVQLQSGEILHAQAVIVATGGVSYPVTGSTGDGYRFAKEAGHRVISPEPSLVSLVEQGSTAKQMTGLSLRNVTLNLWEGKKSVFSETGELLFTHFGVSGPLALSASAHIRDMKKYNYRLTIDLKPGLTPEKLAKRIDADFLLLANKDAANCLVKLLPASMQPVAVILWGVAPDKKVNQITREERRRLCDLLKAFPIALKEKGDLQHAVITSGGVDVKQIDPKTMESRLCKGLFFIGEVLDVDGYTGGYNLTIAFATAYAAAQNL